MFGFLVGTLSLIGLVKLYRHRRGQWNPRRWMLRRFLERLDATPGQEKVILEAVADTEQKARAVRNAVFGARSDVARAMRGEHFKSEAIDDAFAGPQSAAEELKRTVRERLSQVHEALTPPQREICAQLLQLEPGSFGHRCGRHTAPGSFNQPHAVNL